MTKQTTKRKYRKSQELRFVVKTIPETADNEKVNMDKVKLIADLALEIAKIRYYEQHPEKKPKEELGK